MYPNIEAERARLGMTRVDLAKALDVSYSTLKAWMSGKRDIPCSKLVNMSKLFNVSTDYLLGFNGQKPA